MTMKTTETDTTTGAASGFSAGLGAWTAVGDALPEDETPVLICSLEGETK